MPTPIPLGAPIWADAVSTDYERDLDFYTGLFGWLPLDSGEEFLHYTDLRLGAGAVAGVVGSSPEFLPDAPSRWTVYFRVADCEEAAERAESLGGTVLMGASAVGDDLSYALIADPVGAHFGLFEQRGDGAGFQAYGEVGAPFWFEYAAEELSRPVEFYRRLLGWEVNGPKEIGFGEPLAWAGFTAPGAGEQFGGSHLADATDRKFGDRWTVSYRVASAARAVERALELGGEVAKEPYDAGAYRLAELISPTGALFGVVSQPE